MSDTTATPQEQISPLFLESIQISEAKSAIASMDFDRAETYRFLKAKHDKGYYGFWDHQKLTPQQQCDAAGNKAYLIFLVSKETQDLLCLLNPYIDEEHPGYVRLDVPNGCSVDFKEGGFVDVIDNRVKPDPTVKVPAPKLQWNKEGVNPEFAVPEENTTPSE